MHGEVRASRGLQRPIAPGGTSYGQCVGLLYPYDVLATAPRWPGGQHGEAEARDYGVPTKYGSYFHVFFSSSAYSGLNLVPPSPWSGSHGRLTHR